MFFVVTKDKTFEKEFTELIAEAVKMAMQESVSNKSSALNLYTREEAAKMLSVDLSTLHSWVNKGFIASYGIGSRRYFKESDILEALVKIESKVKLK
jgi:excisionase family DNA binding protein